MYSDNFDTDLFMNLSHELRTPLNVMLSSQKLLRLYMHNEEDFSTNKPKIDGQLSIIQKNCNRLLKLFNNLIYVSMLESGDVKLNKTTIDIVKLVDEIILYTSSYMAIKNITLTFETALEEKFILCDVDKVEKIILNLLSNSLKFTPSSGSVNIKLYCKEGHVILSIKDNGIGIPKYDQSLVFEKFKMVDESLTRCNEGSGLGLYIVKSLVEMHGGSISINSSLGNGSEFIVKLPDLTFKKADQSENTRLRDISNRIDNINIEFSDIQEE